MSSEFIHNTPDFIITSQRAVEVFHECLATIVKRDPALASIIRGKTGYTVGPATEQVLRENGFTDVRGGRDAGNGSKLAEIILKERTVSEPIVFFTGEIRKDVIPVKLKAEGVPISEVVIYKTEPREQIFESYLSRASEAHDWLVFFSPQGTEEIVAYLQQNLLLAKIASIGPTTEAYLIEQGLRPDVVAALPTAASLYEAISHL